MTAKGNTEHKQALWSLKISRKTEELGVDNDVD